MDEFDTTVLEGEVPVTISYSTDTYYCGTARKQITVVDDWTVCAIKGTYRKRLCRIIENEIRIDGAWVGIILDRAEAHLGGY